MRTSDLAVQHARHTPGVTHALRIVTNFRRGDSAAIGGNILIEGGLASRGKRGFFGGDIQFTGCRGLLQEVGLEFIRPAGDVAVGLEWGFAVVFSGEVLRIEGACEFSGWGLRGGNARRSENDQKRPSHILLFFSRAGLGGLTTAAERKLLAVDY